MAEGGAFLRSDPALARPDLQVHFVIGIVDQHLRKLHLPDGWSAHVCALRPHSRGTVGLTSATRWRRRGSTRASCPNGATCRP